MSAQMGSFPSFIYVDIYKDVEFLFLKREEFNLLSLKCQVILQSLNFRLWFTDKPYSLASLGTPVLSSLDVQN